MGIYSQHSQPDLLLLRTRLLSSLHDRLTGATSASYNGRSIQYQQRTDDIRKEIAEIDLELSRREGRVIRGPIYLA